MIFLKIIKNNILQKNPKDIKFSAHDTFLE